MFDPRCVLFLATSRGQVSLAFYLAVTVYACRRFTEFTEEMKKTIANLCSSAVQAMKVEIEMLKNGATDSGNNPAGSQNSDLVPSNNPPAPSKRRKTVSEATDSSEDEARDEEEEPPVNLHSTGGNGRSAKLVEMSEEATAIIEAGHSS